MDTLPDEVLELIFMNLGGSDLVACSFVCKRWFNIISTNNSVWKLVVLREKIKEEQELALYYEDYIYECGLWKTYFRLHTERCNNWKNNKFLSLQKGGDSWFFQGWSSFQNICLIPTYTNNTVDVFKVTGKELLLEQQILLPVPGLEPTFLLANSQAIAAVKSNIALLYKKIRNKYILAKMFACRSGAIVKFIGDPENTDSVEKFITSNYIRCGMVRVIEFKETLMWLCDYNNGRLFVVEDDKGNIPTWFIIDSVTFFKTGSGYVCFWTNKCLSLCSIQGDTVFALGDIGIDCISFNEKFIVIKFTSRSVIESYNIKKRESLTTIAVTYDTSLVVHDDSVFVLQLQKFSLACHDIYNGEIRWKIPYKIPGPPRAPLFNCQLSVILDRFLLVFPSHRYRNHAAKFTSINVKTGEILYTSKYNGMVIEISDRLLVTLGTRREDIETGNNIDIRCYI